jgi:ABC-type nitrate/sulfonate/bicarbonate transport system, permease component
MKKLSQFLLPMVGILLVGALWWLASAVVSKDLPSPWKTWQESKLYILEPFEKRGEMDQGIGRLAAYSLLRVAKGFFLGILLATPLGFILGMSNTFHKMMDPVIQVLRPISPLAWLPLGLIIFRQSNRRRSSPSRSAPCGRP